MRKHNKIIFSTCIVLGFTAVLAGAALTGGEKVPKDFTVSYDGITTADIKAGVSVHDPSVIEADGTYYIFGSHMSAASSKDLRNWTSIGDGYTQSNPIFDNLLGTEHVFDYTGSKDSVIPTDDKKYHVWAPDVIYNRYTLKSPRNTKILYVFLHVFDMECIKPVLCGFKSAAGTVYLEGGTGLFRLYKGYD